MAKKGKKKRSGGGRGGGRGAAAEAPAPLFANAPGSPPELAARGNPVLPHIISLESNLGVPCWTLDELPCGQKMGWPNCHVCGKPNSSKFCQRCVDWGLPLEITCSPECANKDYEGHVKRLHEPEGEWAAAKGAVMRKAQMGGDGMGPMAMYQNIFAMIEENYPHPRDRNNERQKMGKQGKQWVRDAKEFEERLAEFEESSGEEDSEGNLIIESSQYTKSEADGEEVSRGGENGDGDDGKMFAKPSELSASDYETLGARVEDVQEDAMDVILSHLALTELDNVRKVSRFFQSACNARKRYFHSLLKKGVPVEIIGLVSERGKQVNNRMATLNGRINSGRYPVKIKHLTGEVETMGLKAQNLNPFLDEDQLSKENTRISFIEYTSDGKLREGHGRLFDQVLFLLRYAVNTMHGYKYFQGEYSDFYELPRADKSVAACNSQVWSMYRVKPSSAGFRDPDDLSVLDNVIRTLVSDPEFGRMHGEMAKWRKDGPGGRLTTRNFIRFMQSWDRERIHGEFWIVKICASGTLVVHDDDGDFGKVYLVKGIGSTVGEDLPSRMLPFLVRTAFLPLYDFLVYDGILVGRGSASGPMKEKILAHTSRAVREQTVVYCGKSAAKGLWDIEPPELPSFPEISASNKKEDGGDATYAPSPAERKAASLLLKYAKNIGFKASERPETPSRNKSVLIVRRFGWTRLENPDHRVGLLFTHDQHPGAVHQFQFQRWPCYTLEELLPEVLKKCKSERSVPCVLWIDELKLVSPLKAVLKKAADAVGFHEKINVEWYPPPSEEEQAYVQENPYG